ncbi:MAG: F0F1 ATP synthase subunit B [Candidatus Doudnabacteria bacterium]|nr:F0F1 ATP synthase subunit B [Candidatus Doudnabacteria bacterium]
MDLSSIILAATEVAQETTHAEEASGGVLGTLGINWKLFLAQLINFGIVLFVFWKWIVKPLGQTLTERQERIESGLKKAEKAEEDRKKFDAWKMEELKKARVTADEVLRQATDTANKIKQETIFEAQKQSEKILEQAKSTIAAEKDQMVKEVKQEVATLVVAASEKILNSKLDPVKDHALIKESIKKVK